MSQVQPIAVPVTGNTDASGSFVSTKAIHASMWTVVRFIGQVAGTPGAGGALWTLSGGGLPLDGAVGTLAATNAVLVQPGELLTVTLGGAAANAAVTAQFSGIASPNMYEVLPYYQPSPNPQGISAIIGGGTVGISGNVPVLNATNTLLNTNQEQLTVSGGNPWAINTSVPGGTASKNFVLPTINGVAGQGVHALGFGISGSTGNYREIALQGHQTLIPYDAVTGILSSSFLLFPVASVYDTSYDVTVSYAVATGTLDIWVVAILDTLGVQVGSAAPLPMVPFDANNGNANSFDNTPVFDSMMVSMLGANPAPWQAPNLQLIDITGAYAANSNNQIVTGVSGKSVYLHSVAFTIDTPTAVGNDLSFCDGSLGAGGTRRGRIGTQAQPPALPFRGVRVTSAGNGLWMTPSAAVTLRGYVAVSQG